MRSNVKMIFLINFVVPPPIRSKRAQSQQEQRTCKVEISPELISSVSIIALHRQSR